MNDDAATPSFDVKRYLTTLTRNERGGGERKLSYLEVKYRLLWLRTEHPRARITTEMIEWDREHAVFKATIELPDDGGSATGYGSETVGDWKDYEAKAETKSLGRACAALGYGTQFAIEFDEGEYPADRASGSPAGRAAALQRSADSRRTRTATELRSGSRETSAAPQRESADSPRAERAPTPTSDNGTSRPDVISREFAMELYLRAIEVGLSTGDLRDSVHEKYGHGVRQLSEAEGRAVRDELASRYAAMPADERKDLLLARALALKEQVGWDDATEQGVIEGLFPDGKREAIADLSADELGRFVYRVEVLIATGGTIATDK
jgi:hypothetical protein